MEFCTIILRFRDLVTEENRTIELHQEIIKSKNYVWWGWWNKGNEKVPFDEFAVLKQQMKETLDLYLMDSGQKRLYKAKCCDMEYRAEGKIESPKIDHTPDYYNNQSYYAWFKLTEIQECDSTLVRKFSYINVNSVYVESSSDYSKFNNKRIYNIQEMIQQNRTLWFVRNYEEEKDSDYEIALVDAFVVEPHDFSGKYYETNCDSLLWLSDLHFGKDNHFKVKIEDSTDVTMTMHIESACKSEKSSIEIERLGGMLITGDITSFGEAAGFEKAKEFLKDLNRILVRKLNAENIVICPGNHDLIRKEKELGKDVPEKVWESPDSIKAYKEFYYSIYNLNPNQYLACGRKLLMPCGRTVEIASLNSLILQQYKDFEGHGFLSKEQLEYVAEKMDWKENEQTNSIRIVMMHHHYLPTCFVEQVDVKKPSSVVYDAERLMQWLIKYNVGFLLHGHKHQAFIKKISNFESVNGIVDVNRSKNIYVIGMGGTGASKCDNKFATITFRFDEIIVRYFRIHADNIEADTCVETIHIPL